MMVKKFCSLLILIFALETWAQGAPPGMPTSVPAAAPASAATGPEKPNGKRIRRQLNLIVGVDHDEEILIPDKELKIGGRNDFFDINRIKGTDFFRINPKKAGNGITTLIDKETGQILAELRFDIRDDSIEKTMREVQAMLGDIDGIEFKIVNNTIYIDGYVLIPRDLVRIAQVAKTWPPDRVQSLATLSPVARKKIADFISSDVNNPEVKITAVGDYIKLEGQVNSLDEKKRINQIVALYLPDLVIDMAPDGQSMAKIVGRKNSGKIEDLIIDLITIKKDDEKVEPPPKMIQIVAHFVKLSDNYGKSFSFDFSPAVSAQGGSQASNQVNSTIDSTINLLSNLLPKLNWAKVHGFAKVLDTASILIQDKVSGNINRTIQVRGAPRLVGGQLTEDILNTSVSLAVKPIIKAERSGLVELQGLNVTVTTSGKNEIANTTIINTTISVRDRQSAAFGGVIKKGSDNSFGTPTNSSKEALITFNASKSYERVNSQFVVFVTPIIKSSASSGVEQVKKKFRLRD